MTKLEELERYVEAEKANGLVSIHFTPGSEPATTEEAAAVALAMLQYHQPEGLRKQVRPYEDTPSAFTVLKNHFFPKN